MTRRRRPCDACRNRKSRCEFGTDEAQCLMCHFHSTQCTFQKDPPRRLISGHSEAGGNSNLHADPTTWASPGEFTVPRSRKSSSRASASLRKAVDRASVTSYDLSRSKMPHSLLNANLGLNNDQTVHYMGPTHPMGPPVFMHAPAEGEQFQLRPGTSVRRVQANVSFFISLDSPERRKRVADDLAAIDTIIEPYGRQLTDLFFRRVYPYFPMADKHVWLEKQERNTAEISPLSLVGMYAAALRWWDCDEVLSTMARPDEAALHALGDRLMAEMVQETYVHLSMVQGAALLILARQGRHVTLAQISLLIGKAKQLGLHIDCESWSIPMWERSLRRRLAWSLYIIDAWYALAMGTPANISDSWWHVREPTEAEYFVHGDPGNEELVSYVLFLRLIDLSRIVARIVHTINQAVIEPSGSRNVDLRTCETFQAQVNAWFQALPKVSWDLDTAGPSLKSLQLCYITVNVLIGRLMIYCGYAEVPNSETQQMCRESARQRVATVMAFMHGLRATAATRGEYALFWYPGVEHCLLHAGSLIQTMLVTSSSVEEARWFRSNLSEFGMLLSSCSDGNTGFKLAQEWMGQVVLHVDDLADEDIVMRQEMNSAFRNTLVDSMEMSPDQMGSYPSASPD